MRQAQDDADEKFYFFNAGVYKNLRAMGPGDSDEERDGATLKVLFLQYVQSLTIISN